MCLFYGIKNYFLKYQSENAVLSYLFRVSKKMFLDIIFPKNRREVFYFYDNSYENMKNY